MSYDKKLKADSGRKDKISSKDNLSNKASRVQSTSGYSNKLARRAYENARNCDGEYTEGETASDIVNAGVDFGSKVITGGFSSKSHNNARNGVKADSKKPAVKHDAWKDYHDGELERLKANKNPTDSWTDYYNGEIAKLKEKEAKKANKKNPKQKSKKSSTTKESNAIGSVRRKYSDKVFNQSKYQFSKKQRELWDEKNQINTGSFFIASKENLGQVEAGKFSKKLKPSKKKETDKKKEGDDKSKDKNKDRKEKRKETKEERLKREKRMNERKQFERRYKTMRANMTEAKSLKKKAVKRLLKTAKSFGFVVGILIALFLILNVVITSVTTVLLGSFAGSSMTSGIAPNLWNSNRRDIDKAEEYFYKKFLDLKEEIRVLRNADDHDETHQEGDLIYDHFALMSYLHAIHDGKFMYGPNLERDLDRIFNDLFSYSYTIGPEERERAFLNPDTGLWETETIEVIALRITINRVTVDDYAASTLGTAALNYYNVSKGLEGGLQAFGPPANRWRSLTTEYYTSDLGAMEVSTEPGRAVFAMRNGVVTEKGSDYIKVEGEDGASYMISGISNITLSVGDSAVRGVALGTTGSRLKISEWIDGEPINPLFYTRVE